MRFGQLRIRFDCAQRRVFGPLPRSRRWWLDVPVEQSVAVGELRMSDGKLRIEFNCTFEALDRLAQTFGCSSRRIVTSGSVELASFFILSRLSFGSRHQNLPGYGRNVRP